LVVVGKVIRKKKGAASLGGLVVSTCLDERFHETDRFRYFTSGSHVGSRALARVAKP
jgi:hypothetical protein